MSRSNEPQNVAEGTWYYEERKGLLVVHEVRDPKGRLLQVEQFTIPWRTIAASVKRNKPKPKRTKP